MNEDADMMMRYGGLGIRRLLPRWGPSIGEGGGTDGWTDVRVGFLLLEDLEFGEDADVTFGQRNVNRIPLRSTSSTYSDGKWALGNPTTFSRYFSSTSPRTASTPRLRLEYQM